MKKILFTTVAMLFLSTSAFSQFGVKAGFALGEPLDDNTSNMHLGFDLGVTYDITENIQAEFLLERLSRKETVSLGFLGDFSIQSIYTPITVGANYRFLTDKIQPYAGLNLGMYNISAKVGDNKNSEAYFGLYPKVGLSVEVVDNLLIDATVKYHLIFSGNNNAGGSSVGKIFGANIGLIYKFN